jgi:hypothetical protein
LVLLHFRGTQKLARTGLEWSPVSHFVASILLPFYCHTVVDPRLRWKDVPGRRERKAHKRTFRLLGIPAVGGSDRLGLQGSGLAKQFLEIQRRSIGLLSKAAPGHETFAFSSVVNIKDLPARPTGVIIRAS